LRQNPERAERNRTERGQETGARSLDTMELGTPARRYSSVGVGPMPIYRFHLVPDDGVEDIGFRFADDVAALETAKLLLREIVRKAAPRGRGTSKQLQVLRPDGSVAGSVSTDHRAGVEAG
jgi:hypothetical protein